MINFTPKVFTVSQLNKHIADLINQDPTLGTIFIEGEISNFKINSKSGHMYFSLKDRDSVINAVMFKWAAASLRFMPEAGMKVIMRAVVTVYEPMGQYQLRVEDMQPDGIGVLAMQLEQLKKKLDKEGLFSPEHKKPIPRYPQTIGVITSPTGAAIRDILDILGRRYPCAEVVLAPVLVQGEGAPAQLINAVEMFSQNHAADVLIIGRGGGSMEDLWAFNDEGLARAIYDCEIPVISAVGHETDTTICDFVSDLRAPTPSAAAELAVPDSGELMQNVFAVYDAAYVNIKNRLSLHYNEWTKLRDITIAKTPLPQIEGYFNSVDALTDRATATAENTLARYTDAAHKLYAKLDALNPIGVLARGYAYATHDDKPLRSVFDVKIGDRLDLKLSDGSLGTEVTNIDK